MTVRRLPASQNKYNRRQSRWTAKEALEEETDAGEAMEYLEHKEYINTKNRASWSNIDKKALEKEMYWAATEREQSHWKEGPPKKNPKGHRGGRWKKKAHARNAELHKLEQLLNEKEAKLQNLLVKMSRSKDWPTISGLGVECEAIGNEIDSLREKIKRISAKEDVFVDLQEEEKKLEKELHHSRKSRKKAKQLRRQYEALKSQERKLFQEKKTKQPTRKRVAQYQFEIASPMRKQSSREEKKTAKRAWQTYRNTRTPTPKSPEERNKKMSGRVPVTRVRGGIDTRERNQRERKLLGEGRRVTRKQFKR